MAGGECGENGEDDEEGEQGGVRVFSLPLDLEVIKLSSDGEPDILSAIERVAGVLLWPVAA